MTTQNNTNGAAAPTTPADPYGPYFAHLARLQAVGAPVPPIPPQYHPAAAAHGVNVAALGNGGPGQMNPAIRKMLEERLTSMPEGDPLANIVRNRLAADDGANVPQATQAADQAALNRLLQEHTGRAGAALGEAQRVAADLVDVKAQLNAMVAAMDEHTKVLRTLLEQLPGIVNDIAGRAAAHAAVQAVAEYLSTEAEPEQPQDNPGA